MQQSEAMTALERGADYEAAREILNMIMAYHRGAIRKIGDENDPRSVMHQEEIRRLLTLRRSLNPDMPDLIAIARREVDHSGFTLSPMPEISNNG